MPETFNCIIMGAAGRDFHDFLTFFHNRPEFRVRAFTATQIPFIASRSFPQSLSGPRYAADIPIFPEEELAELIPRFDIDFVFLSYSDLPHETVMHIASLVQSCGASFALLGPDATQLCSKTPVIAVTAVRTGAGKSPLTQWIARHFSQTNRRVAVIRHPMPYGDLEHQRCQRFVSEEDLDRHNCTIEEREEYQPYVELGQPIFAGVDYRTILREAEREADVILWDGGNNDFPFIKPDLLLTVADALRPGHELSFYPGETNLRMADVVVINKVTQAKTADIALIREHIQQVNPRAEIIDSNLEIAVNDPKLIANRRALVVEDGPTVTHGGMSTGAGCVAARQFHTAGLVDPHDFACGSIAEALSKYPHIGSVLPALGYSPEQVRELNETINASGAEIVIDASPAGLSHVLQTSIPIVRVRYEFQQVSGKPLTEVFEQRLSLSPKDRAV